MSTSTKEYREMDSKALLTKLDQIEREWFEYKETVMSGKEKNHTRLRELRREVARIKTVLKEKI